VEGAAIRAHVSAAPDSVYSGEGAAMRVYFVKDEVAVVSEQHVGGSDGSDNLDLEVGSPTISFQRTRAISRP
jgi:hypothetical protein